MPPNLPFGVPGLDLSQIFNVLQEVVRSINNLDQTLTKLLSANSGSATWNPGTIAAGGQATTTVAVSGAVLGNSAQAGFSLDIQGLTLTAYVDSANSVTVVLFNGTAAPITIASGTINVWARSS